VVSLSQPVRIKRLYAGFEPLPIEENYLKSAVPTQEKKLNIFDDDLSEDLLRHYLTQEFIALDTETRGLNIRRDRLCMVQISDKDGNVSLIRFKDKSKLPVAGPTRLGKLLESEKPLKVLHFARFDLAVLKYYLATTVKPIWCTKIASKLVRTYTDRHSLKDLARELLGLEMDKTDQMSDWAREDLSNSQLEYAANDVRLLVPIYLKLKALIEREGLSNLAERLFAVVDVISELDIKGWSNVFEH
jgi:ribonuclease D